MDSITIYNRSQNGDLPVPKKLRFSPIAPSDDENGGATSEDIDIEEQGLNAMKISHVVDCSSLHVNTLSDLQTEANVNITRSEDPDIVLVTCQHVMQEAEIQDKKQNVLGHIKRICESIDIKTSQFEQPKLLFVKSKLRKFLSDNCIGQRLIGYHDDENKSIHLIGFPNDLDEAVNNIMKDMEVEDVTEETIELKPNELKILKLVNFKNEVNGINKELEFVYQEAAVSLKGLSEDVNEVKMKKEKLLQKYTLMELQISERKYTFLQRGEVQQYIQKQLSDSPKTRNCKVLVEQGVLKIVVERKHERECQKIIEKSICEETLTLNDHEKKKAFTDRNWKTLQSNMESHFKRNYYITVLTEGKLHILCTNDIHLEIMETIQDFRRKNALIEKTVTCSPLAVRFVESLLGEPCDESLKKEYVEIERKEGGLLVKATSTGMSRIEDIVKQIKPHFYGILNNECTTYLCSEAGKKDMEQVGKTHRCLVRLKENIDVEIVKGKIEDQKADVIVNSVSGDLNLSVGQPKVATSILEKAGQEFQSELKNEYPKGIQEWEIAFCDGSRLQCKEVFNCCLAKYDPCDSHNKQAFSEIIRKCLNEANKREHTTLKLPALGTGVLKYPPDKVAEMIFGTIAVYIREMETFSLRKIGIVILPENTAVWQAFENAVNTWCPKEPDTGDNHFFLPDQSCSGPSDSRVSDCIYRWQLEIISDLCDVADVVAELETKFKEQKNEETRPKEVE